MIPDYDSLALSNLFSFGELLQEISRQEDFHKAISLIRDGDDVSLDGVYGGLSALICALIAQEFPNRTVCLMVPQNDQLDKSADDIALFSGVNVDTFPALENLTYRKQKSNENKQSDTEFAPTAMSYADDLFGTRLRILKELLPKNSGVKNNSVKKNTDGRIIVTSISSLLQPVPDQATLQERTCSLRVGEEIEQEDLVRRLVNGGYHSTSGVDLPGEYAVRGGIIDIFAPDWDKPIRVEFFGNEIESIRRFDIATQRSLETIESVELSWIRPDEVFTSFFSDYLHENAIFVLLESPELESQGRTYRERAELDELHTTSEVLKRVLKFQTISLSNLSQGALDELIPLPTRSIDRLHGDLNRVRDTLNETEGRICVVCPTEAEIQRLLETLSETQPYREERLHFALGNLSAGFSVHLGAMLGGSRTKKATRSAKTDKTVKSAKAVSRSKKSPSEISSQKANAPWLTLIGSTQLFERQELRKTRRRQLGQVIDSFTELKPGDLVVHVSHGIGRFRGLKLLSKIQQEEEHLELEFAGGATLFVPVSRIALVQKYVGGTKSKPPLAKLGGSIWNKHKQAVQQAVFDLATEMIDLQASREAFPGISYPEDTDWQLEFDAAFPYRETEDQIFAIDAIKKDMQLSRPMDRLICGDVGFGKTEVAMRAAFKAVDAGYQVAVLVPTTILAEQHYRTFTERMREFPFSIAALSRFQSKKEQKQIIENLALGAVDIVIGTHRIVSKDVQFHNLGLVVIDEEQRFGVDHKERLKKLRTTVDILTLTATPIPRTLHFSLLGLRDISNLETPPEDRMAVETKMVRFHPELIRSAILREIERGGQAYFVHNRVMDIDDTASQLQKIVPEARFGVGHAQMHEDELEKVMHDFVDHRFDVLVCTTIIESGLDIPNANTIFIDRSDRYGLADLHQLRGRVGRYKNQAYCYLLLDANQPLTAVAAKRLRAIEEYSHLGAGFSIAMRDLEIRGAGNILGTQQSGHIAVVGYEMYCQFLEGAVRMLKQMPQVEHVQVEVDLPVRAVLPKSYIPNQRMKIDLYRRLVRIVEESQWEDIRAEIIDRFGKPPKEVQRLLQIAKIRIAAHKYRIRSISVKEIPTADAVGTFRGRQLVMDFVSQILIDRLQEKLREENRKTASKSPPLQIRITDEMKAYIALPKKFADPQLDLHAVSDALLRFVEKVLG